MIRLFYKIKNKILRRKPYMSLEKYIQKMKDTEYDREFISNVTLNFLNNENQKWYIKYNGSELIQISDDQFMIKGDKSFIVTSYWVEWKKT